MHITDNYMKYTAVILAVCCLCCSVCSVCAQEEKEDTAEHTRKGYLIKISDQKDFMVDTVLSTYIRNSLKRARGADTVFLQLDTYGGKIISASEIRESIHQAADNGLNIVAYIPEKAVSAGAAITVACSEIVMKQGAHFGDSAPVMMTSEGPKMLSESDKTTSVLRKQFETSCKKNGYPYRIGHAMVSQNFATYVIEESSSVKIYSYREFEKLPPEQRKKISGGDVPSRTEFYFPENMRKRLREESAKPDARDLSEPVTLVIDEVYNVDGQRKCFLSETKESKKDFISLSDAEYEFVKRELSLKQIDTEKELVELSAEEAYAYHFARNVVDGTDELFELYGLVESDVTVVEPSPAETAVRWLNHPLVASLLIMIGIIAIYAELHTPGFGLAGAAALICFALYFLFSFLARDPHLLPVILFISGIVLLLLEIFVIPGFGIAGIGGILFMLLGLLTVRLPGDIYRKGSDVRWSAELFYEPVTVVFGGFLLGLAGCVVLARFLPEIRLFSSHIVTGPVRMESGASGSTGAARIKTEITEGDEAVVTADLRPSGKIDISGRQVAAVSSGDYISKGSRVRVVSVQGNRITVEET